MLATVGDRASISNYFQEINDTLLLSPEEEQCLAERVQEGDSEAREEMVRANLRLVVAIARTFQGKGMCLQDLIQEGNLGLLHAVERFEPDRATRFSTYARFWIQHAIRSSLEKLGAPLRIPGYANDLLVRWHQASGDLQRRLGRKPTEDEIALELKLSPRKLKIVQKALRVYRHLPFLGDSHDSPNGSEPIVDPREPAPQEKVMQADELQHVLQCLDRLPNRLASILRLRFGLAGENPLTLNEIGDRLHLTRERVRQLEQEALACLRSWIEKETDR